MEFSPAWIRRYVRRSFFSPSSSQKVEVALTRALPSSPLHYTGSSRTSPNYRISDCAHTSSLRAYRRWCMRGAGGSHTPLRDGPGFFSSCMFSCLRPSLRSVSDLVSRCSMPWTLKKSAAIIVTIVFWAVLHSGTPFVNQFQGSSCSNSQIELEFSMFRDSLVKCLTTCTQCRLRVV